MEGQGLMSSQFPPGFRFHPTDEELIMQYLWKKASASLPSEWAIITDIDLYKFNPWELPEKALFGQGEWFFFTPRDRKYPNGVRPNRAAASGYWKATGTDKPILATGGTQCIGVKKALVFYKGRPPKGTKTEWVMQEYRLLDSMTPSPVQKQKGSMRLDDWVLCRVRQKDNSGAGSDDMPTDSSLADARIEGKQGPHREGSSSCEWTEHLGFLLESTGEQGREGSADDLGHGGFMWSPNNLESLCYAQPQQPLPQPQQPNKRLQCSADGWLAQTESASVDQGCFPGYSIH